MQSTRQYVQLYTRLVNNRQSEETDDQLANITFTLDSEQSRHLLH